MLLLSYILPHHKFKYFSLSHWNLSLLLCPCQVPEWLPTPENIEFQAAVQQLDWYYQHHLTCFSPFSWSYFWFCNWCVIGVWLICDWYCDWCVIDVWLICDLLMIDFVIDVWLVCDWCVIDVWLICDWCVIDFVTDFVMDFVINMCLAGVGRRTLRVPGTTWPPPSPSSRAPTAP